MDVDTTEKIIPDFSDMTIYEAECALYDPTLADMVVETPDFDMEMEDPFGNTYDVNPDYTSVITNWKKNTDYLLLENTIHIIPPKQAKLHGSSRTKPRMVLMIPADDGSSEVSLVTVKILSIETRKLDK